jgi:hypothetical protein
MIERLSNLFSAQRVFMRSPEAAPLSAKKWRLAPRCA